MKDVSIRSVAVIGAGAAGKREIPLSMPKEPLTMIVFRSCRSCSTCSGGRLRPHTDIRTARDAWRNVVGVGSTIEGCAEVESRTESLNQDL